MSLGYGDSTQNVWIAAAERREAGWTATLTEDRRIQSLFRLNVTAGVGKNLQTGYQSLGETRGFELFTPEAVERTVLEAVRLAFQALTARPAPAGTFPVILSSSAGGTMIHEACGHGLEADLALAGVSAFSGKLGQRVAAPGVTIIDDGTLPHKRGSSASDDEGNPARRVVLIEDGVLVAYLQSRKTARRMGVEPTGNGRRESYRHLPIPRMRNTFLAPGGEAPEAIVKDLERGPAGQAHGRRAGGHGHRQLRVPGHRGLLGGARRGPVPGEERHPHRLRPGSAHGPHPHRHRPASLRHRHLRQGRPGRAGVRRPAHHPLPRPDRGRHRRSPSRAVL